MSEELEAQVQAALDIAKRANRRVDELEDEVEDLRAENERLREELESLRERTDLVQTVQKASNLKPEERAAVCIQTLYNRAHAREQLDEPALAEMDIQQAITALGGGVNRTAIYRTFEKVEELVDELDVGEKVLRYKKEDRSSTQNSRLILNLEEGDLPPVVAGHEISAGNDAVAGHTVDSSALGGGR